MARSTQPTMHPSIILVTAFVIFLSFKLISHYFGRFGARSEFRLWRKFQHGLITIYVVESRISSERCGGVCPATFYPKLKLTFAGEQEMKYLAKLDLPSGIDISSRIDTEQVMSLHFHGRRLCEIERREGSVFLKNEMYALVDAERAKTKVISEGNMVATA